MSDLDLDELRSELDDFAQPAKKGGPSPRQERIIAGFEEIQRFVEKHGHAPQHGEDRDIFERLSGHRSGWHAAHFDAHVRDELSTGAPPPSLTR